MKHFGKIPAFKFAILLACGIIVGYNFQFNIFFILILIIAHAVFCVFLAKKSSNKYFIFASVSILILMLGIFKAGLDFHLLPENSISNIPDTKQNSKYLLIGVVTELPDYDSNRVRFVLGSKKIIVNRDTFNVSGEVITTVLKDRYKYDNNIPPLIKPGDEVLIKGKLMEAYGERNPGEFNYSKYLKLHNIHKTFIAFSYENISLISEGNMNFLYKEIIYPAKIFALENIDRHTGGDEGAYLKGLITGERSDLSREMKEAFINTGVMHLIAVSGLNVAYIIIAITVIFVIIRVPGIPRLILTILALIFYCLFTGSPASIVRATIMGVLLLLTIELERKPNFYNTIGVSVIIILLIDAKQFYDPGFILSYGAVLSMVFFYERFKKLFRGNLKEWYSKDKKFMGYIFVLAVTTLAAQIGTLPLTANYFGKISVISILANIVAIPLANLSLAVGLFQVTAGIFSDYLSSIIAFTNKTLLTVQLNFIKWCASLDFAYFEFYRFNIFNIISYFTILTLLLTITKRNYKFSITLSGILIAAVIIFNLDFRESMQVTFLDVGEGNSTLIKTPSGRVILVDCGRKSFSYNSGERTIVPYLKRKGINKIDLLIISDLKAYNTGGFKYIVENIPIGKVLHGIRKKELEFETETGDIIKQEKIPVESIRSGDYIDSFDDVRLYFLNPPLVQQNGGQNSVTFKLKHRDNEFLFTGNISSETDSILSEKFGKFLEVDVLKVPGNGRAGSLSAPFLEKCKAKLSVISCGINNRYNHPAEIVLNKLKASGSSIFRTDIQGAVIIESDGCNTKLIKWR